MIIIVFLWQSIPSSIFVYILYIFWLNFFIGLVLFLFQLFNLKKARLLNIKTLHWANSFLNTLIILLYCLYQLLGRKIPLLMILGLMLFAINFILERFKIIRDVPSLEIRNSNIRKIPGGDIKIGKIISKGKVAKRFKISLEDIKRHILIYGQTGSGKSFFLKYFLESFAKNYSQIPFLLFEFKGEYRSLSNSITNLKIIKPGTNFRINVFDQDIFRGDIFVEVLFNSLKSCNIIQNENAEFSPQMEKVLVDCLRQVCSKAKKKSWNTLFQVFDRYVLKYKTTIPNLEQTIISLKNRLRRYHSGPLRVLFSDQRYSEKKFKISHLLNTPCIIELGNILKLGGSKEDVLFFSNLILKWIWEKNMQKESTNKLKHLTIVEDTSYIASNQLLNNSRLSTYLEDIALLLRGKGEALITLTTTLDISKNIILNSGSKFFFKFNEKKENVLHYLGIDDKTPIDLRELITGYCLVKIDSISEPFLLKTFYMNNRSKKRKHESQEREINEKCQKYSIDDNLSKRVSKSSEIVSKTNKVKNEKKPEDPENEVPNENVVFKLKKIIYRLKFLILKLNKAYLIEEYKSCASIIYEVSKKLRDFAETFNKSKLNRKCPDYNHFCKIIEFNKKLKIIESNTAHIKSSQIKDIHYFITIMNELTRYFKKNTRKLENNSANRIQKQKLEIKKIYLNVLKSLRNEKELKLYVLNQKKEAWYSFYNIGKYDPQIQKFLVHLIEKRETALDLLKKQNHFQLFVSKFGIERGRNQIDSNTYLILIIYCKEKKALNFFTNEYFKRRFNKMRKKINEKQNLEKAFYLRDVEKMRNMKSNIKAKSIFLKTELRGFWEKLNNYIRAEKKSDLKNRNIYEKINTCIKFLQNQGKPIRN